MISGFSFQVDAEAQIDVEAQIMLLMVGAD